jgi:hypothetical protein
MSGAMLLKEHARANALLQDAAAMVVDLKCAQPSERRRDVDGLAHGTRTSSDMDRGVMAMALSSSMAGPSLAVLLVALKVRTDVA